MKRLHEGAIKDDPFISAALGPKAKIERMRAAALRLGSQGLSTSFDDHLLIIGDAAGTHRPLDWGGHSHSHDGDLVLCSAATAGARTPHIATVYLIFAESCKIFKQSSRSSRRV